MRRILDIMDDIFDPNGFDWMNFVLSKKNPYTYHHINEEHNGGVKSIDNGAILTRKAHDLLNILEKFCPDAYDDLQKVFMRINGEKKPLTNEIIKEIDQILYRVLISCEYIFTEEIDLEEYRILYYQGRKKLKKRLK